MTRALRKACTGPLFLLIFLIASARPGLATTAILPADDDMIVSARAIVRATVLSVSCGLDQRQDHVYTYTTLRVSEVIKGEIASRRITIKQMGGQMAERATKAYGSPQFTPGENVVLFLDTWANGSFRVHGMFLGKFSIVLDPDTGQMVATRGVPETDVTLLQQPGGQTITNRMALKPYLKMLRSRLAANLQRAADFESTYYTGVPLLSEPPEYRDGVAGGGIQPQFHLFSPPVRWFQPDTGQPVMVLTNPDQQPNPQTPNDVAAAMNAWSTVQGCSLRLVNGGTTSLCETSNAIVVDFNNCLNFFSPSGGCQLILAEGGWDSTSGAQKTVNGTTFYQITAGFVSFNPYASCVFGNHCNVQLITTHEMGHSLGLHHSWDPIFGGSPTPVEQDATMYYIANFDGRCASVHTDDINGITFVYPGSASTTNYQGFHDGAGCGTISGWAWDANNPGNTVSVDIYDGANLIATTPANMYREDLLNVLGSPNHGFSFPTPAALLNGAVHSISVKISGTSITLGGGPKSIRCTGVTNLQGSHDGAGCNTICGWAWNANDPGNIVNVDIYADGLLIGTAAATQYRQDLADIYGQPYHGFNFPTPASLRNGLRHIITVKFGGTSTNLTWNTPKAFTCSGGSPTYQGTESPASCATISGYAWNTSDDSNIVNVAIYADGAFVVVVPAQQVSPGIGNGYHGFAFAVPPNLRNGLQHSIQVKFSGTSTSLTNSPTTITCP